LLPNLTSIEEVHEMLDVEGDSEVVNDKHGIEGSAAK